MRLTINSWLRIQNGFLKLTLIACSVCCDASLLRTTVNTVQELTGNLATRAVIAMHIAKHCSTPSSLACHPCRAPWRNGLLQRHSHPCPVTAASTFPSARWTCCSISLSNANFSQAQQAMNTLSVLPSFLGVSKILAEQK